MLILQPQKFKDWQADIDFYDAQEYCKWWSKYRKWLIENEVSLTDFKQEIQYNHLIKHYDFRNKARNVRITKELNL